MGVFNRSSAIAAGSRRRAGRVVGGLVALVTALAVLPAGNLSASASLPARAPAAPAKKPAADNKGKLLFFASDGLQQGLVERYAKDGVVPGFRDLLQKGAKASDNGLLTQAPPNTGAGW